HQRHPRQDQGVEDKLMLPAVALILFHAAAHAARIAVPENTIRVSIYHTNDIHGWIMPRPFGSTGDDAKRMIGGMGVYANWVRRDRGPKLVLDAGDWFQGTPEGM